MTRPLRIGFGRIAQETNSYSKLPTTLADFKRFGWLEGADLMAACEPSGVEAPGFLKNAELSGFVRGVRAVSDAIALVPLLSAWAIPSGPLTTECLHQLIEALAQSLLDAGPLDGLMLSMHGAMGAYGSEDPDADVIEAVRAIVGPDLPIAVTLDLHAQVGKRFVDGTDIVCAYRTNPHRDHARVGQRCGDLLARALLGQVQPTHAWRSLPLVLGGGTTIDFFKPMRSVYRWMKQQERDPKVLYLSLFNAHMWNDSRDLGWATHVITDGDEALADRLAEELAELLWQVRHHELPHFPSPGEAIERARKASLRRKLGAVLMCDASDVVGAGAPGENTRLLRALLDGASDMLSYAPIRDVAAVEAAWAAEIGDRISVTVGGRFDPEGDPPLAVEGRVAAKAEPGAIGRLALLDLGHVQLVVTDGPPLAMKPEFYTCVGLSPWKADIVVVKSFFPFRFYFLPHNRLTLYVRTEGVTDWHVGLRTAFHEEVHPLHDVDDWRDVDRRRRAGEP